jgi:hypothetical protein
LFQCRDDLADHELRFCADMVRKLRQWEATPKQAAWLCALVARFGGKRKDEKLAPRRSGAPVPRGRFADSGARQDWYTTGRGQIPSAVRKIEARPPGAGLPPKVAIEHQAEPARPNAPKARGRLRRAGLGRGGHGNDLGHRRGCSSYALRSRPHQRAETYQSRVTRVERMTLHPVLNLDRADFARRSRFDGGDLVPMPGRGWGNPFAERANPFALCGLP